MQFLALIAALATATSGVAIKGRQNAQSSRVYFDNHLDVDIYVIEQYANGANSSTYTLPSGKVDAYDSPVTNAALEQHAFTISKDPAVQHDLLQAVFNVKDGVIYYSLSTIFGDPLQKEGYGLYSKGNGYNIISPVNRTGDPEHEYTPRNRAGVGAVFTATSGDFVFSLGFAKK